MKDIRPGRFFIIINSRYKITLGFSGRISMLKFSSNIIRLQLLPKAFICVFTEDVGIYVYFEKRSEKKKSVPQIITSDDNYQSFARALTLAAEIASNRGHYSHVALRSRNKSLSLSLLASEKC